MLSPFKIGLTYHSNPRWWISSKILQNLGNPSRLFYCSIWLPASSIARSDSGHSRCSGRVGKLYGPSHRRRLHPAKIPQILQRSRWGWRGQVRTASSLNAVLHETWTRQVKSWAVSYALKQKMWGTKQSNLLEQVGKIISSAKDVKLCPLLCILISFWVLRTPDVAKLIIQVNCSK